ncbi:hypothetical protein HK100_003639 [Physocladia obscura]|uniref:alpha-1,6-mannosyl-glycoprotein 6-beta-N-acetylglucosaminyltransferase n=1 Tax=Physocladia obscura TaxID=109957 RepID=A0AAD5SWE9_9FUNG|nr:hypothetical protein HK100_003639 [Physocladia obscura]
MFWIFAIMSLFIMLLILILPSPIPLISPHSLVTIDLSKDYTRQEIILLRKKIDTYEGININSGGKVVTRGRGDTALRMRSLVDCLAESHTCREYQKKVVILASKQFRDRIMGKVSGEAIWAGSILQSLDLLGFTALMANNLAEATEIFSIFKNLTTAIISDRGTMDLAKCWKNRRDQNCFATENKPDLLPIWKILTMEFWASCEHPLGTDWCLVPENYGAWLPNFKATYIGYSMENECTKIEFVPWDKRPNRTYILAKKSAYLKPERINLGFINSLATDYDIKFVMGTIEKLSIPNISNLGFLSEQGFQQELANSKVLLGVGDPAISPSPYNALCSGVPFINPIKTWNENKKWDRSAWSTQHDGLKYLDPPYVYNVNIHDADAIKDAIMNAMITPISGRYISDHMTVKSMLKRAESLILTDWCMKAKNLHAMRLEFGGENFYL